MKPLFLSLCIAPVAALAAFAEPVDLNTALKILPKANAPATIASYDSILSERDRAALSAAQMSATDVYKAIGATLEGYGAVAISPDEGVLVEWISGVSQHHSRAAARAAAMAYCNAQKKRASANCVPLVEVYPRGATETDPLTLSASANAALRGAFRKLDRPRAFAISPGTGDFGFDRGDGSRALAACAAAGSGANDCKIVVSD